MSAWSWVIGACVALMVASLVVSIFSPKPLPKKVVRFQGLICFFVGVANGLYMMRGRL